MKFPRLNRRSRSVKAVSPTISTVILTGTIVVLLGAALTLVNNIFWIRVAENDFNSAKQFMQTIGLQIDDVAWIIGRTETVRFSSMYGEVRILSSALNYTVYVNTTESGGYQKFVSYNVSVLLFNVPETRYSLFNGYYESIFPSSTSNLILTGTSAPVVRVFAIEKLPMGDGDFIRVVVAPSVRSLFSNMTSGGSTTSYIKLYLPVLTPGRAPRLDQSVTVTGSSLTATTINHVTGINVTVNFPRENLGFNNSFFQFPSLYEEISIPQGYDDSVLEFWAGEVIVELGARL